MNTVNRILIVILLLVVMVLCNILLVVPGAIDAVALQSAVLADFFSTFQPWARVGIGAIFALALDVVLGLFIILEVRRPKHRAIRVEKATGGEVQVSINSIADRLSHEIDRLPDVLRVRSKVGAKRGGVVIDLDVETVAGIDVPQKAALIIEQAQQVIKEQMGVKLSKPPQVNLRAAPYSETPKMTVSPKVNEEPPVASRPAEQDS